MDSEMERVCGRAEDLVGFLYGELNDADSKAFSSHLEECAWCGSELKAFGDLRQSVIAWRNESLNPLSTPRSVNVPVQGRSAVGAIREFFNLSPVWMKATVGFASVLFCIFAVLAVSGLRQSSSLIVTNAENRPSAAEIDALVKQRVADELNRRAQQTTVKQDEVQPINTAANSLRKKRMVRYQNDARRPLTRVEREQLAADLRLISGPNDSELELLSDAINQ